MSQQVTMTERAEAFQEVLRHRGYVVIAEELTTETDGTLYLCREGDGQLIAYSFVCDPESGRIDLDDTKPILVDGHMHTLLTTKAARTIH